MITPRHLKQQQPWFGSPNVTCLFVPYPNPLLHFRVIADTGVRGAENEDSWWHSEHSGRQWQWKKRKCRGFCTSLCYDGLEVVQ